MNALPGSNNNINPARGARRILSHGLTRQALVLLGFLGLTALMTWPWVTRMRDAVADEGDPYMIAWTLWWDYHQTFTDPLHLFQANIFYPCKYTLAFSEHDYGIALLFFPLFAAGLRPLTVHSFATFFGFAFSGYAQFRLTRTLTRSTGAAWVSGIFFAFVPYRFNLLSHLHYLFAGWIPLLLEALVLFVRRRSWPRAAWLGVAFVMNALTCISYFILTLMPLALSAVFLIFHYRVARDRNFWIRGGTALGIASLTLLPFMLPYYFVMKLYGFIRTADEVASNSPTPLTWLVADDRNKIWRGLGDAITGTRKEPLFPGLLALLLSLPALASPKPKTQRGDAVALGLIWIICGFLGSLGMNFFLNRVLYDFVPLFRAIRIPAHWAMITYVGLGLLAGLGSKRIAEKVLKENPNSRKATMVFVLIAIALLFELRAAPLSFVRGKVYPDGITLKLKQTSMKGGIVELPIVGEEMNLHRYMLRSADHQKPLVMGNSSFTSPQMQQIEAFVAENPINDRLLDLLEEIPASYLVIHSSLVPPEQRVDYESFLARASNSNRLRFVRSYGDRDDLYAVAKTEPAAKAEAPLPFAFEAWDWSTLIKEDPVNVLGQYRSWSQSVYRFYIASYGRMPRYSELLADVELLGRGVAVGSTDEKPKLAANLTELATAWMARPQFQSQYQHLGGEQYVDDLAVHSGITLDKTERGALVDKLNRGAITRADVLLELVGRPEFADKEEIRSLVLLYYFGYFLRNPDDPPDNNLEGFNYWVGQVETSGDKGRLSRGFLAAGEYKDRRRDERAGGTSR